MERVFNLVFVAAMACGAQLAWSQSSSDAPAATAESDDTDLNVAAFGQAIERHAAAEAQMAPQRESLLEEIGLAGQGALPSRSSE